MNLSRPLDKPKYYLATDSELVSREGKVKMPLLGVKYLNPLHTKFRSPLWGDGVPLHNESASCCLWQA